MDRDLSELQNYVNNIGNTSKAAREKNKAKNNPSAWRKTWVDVLCEHYPECVVDYPDLVAKHLKDAIAKRGFPEDDMQPFLTWVVKNWPTVRRQIFSMNPMKPRGPETPDLRTLIPYIGQAHALFTRSKPEHALTAKHSLTARTPSAAPALTVRPKPAPAKPLAPVRAVPRVAPTIDLTANAAARQRLGLRDWKS